MNNLIIFEGPDGSGKTTQVKLLAEKLEAFGKKVKITREPGGTPLGEDLRKLLLEGDYNISKETEMYLFAASRRAHSEKILEWIKEGYTVICDRNILSSIVYQSNESLNPTEIRKVNTIALDPILGGDNRFMSLIRPITILFDMDLITYVQRNTERINSRGLDNIESRHTSEKEITEMLNKYRNNACINSVNIDVSGKTIEEIHLEIIDTL